MSQASRSSQPYEWEPSPPIPQRKVATPLSGSEARLKAIQEALAGYNASVPPGPPLAKSQVPNKRPSPTAEPATVPQPKRARQLPPDWGRDPLSAPSGFSDSRSKKGVSKSSPASSTDTVGGKPKLASVFLSQEQTKILKLVQEGESLFYTGSAGR